MTKFTENIFNEYSIKARLFPALLCLLPFILLKHSVIDRYYNVSFNQIIFGDISLGLILVYLLIQVNRFISKLYFEDKNGFPTDKKLMPSGVASLSREMRDKIGQKVHEDFGLTLPTLADENMDPDSARTRVREIVKLIIGKVKNGELLLQHNIEYGFVRNFLGGSIIAILLSICSLFLFVVIFYNTALVVVSLVLLLAYLIPVIFSKEILNQYSDAYSDILFREYLQINKKG